MRNILNILLAISLMIFVASCGKQTAEKSNKTETTETMAEPAQTDTATTTQAVPELKQPEQTIASSTPAKKEETKQPVTSTHGEEKVKTAMETRKETPPPIVITVPESTTVQITLVDSIDTDVHVTGTKFRATLAEPIKIDGKVVFDEGAEVIGMLDKVVESGHLKTPAELSFSLTSIADRTGAQVPITTYQIYEKKDSHTKKEVGLIGGGAIVGGIIGKLSKKKGGTEIGAAAGAAAGTAAAAAAGKQDIVHSAGTEVTFYLRESVKVTEKTGPFTSH